MFSYGDARKAGYIVTRSSVMSKQNRSNETENGKLLKKLLIDSSYGRSLSIKAKLAAITATTITIITIVAGVVQILGITVLGFFENTSVENAIRIDSSYSCYNVGVVKNVDTQYTTGGIYFADGEQKRVAEAGIYVNASSLCTNPILGIDIVSLSNHETIKLAPFLVVKTIKVTPLPISTKFNFIEGVGGADGNYHTAHVILGPNQDKNTAAFTEPAQMLLDNQGQNRNDFFKLAPGEGESFLLNFHAFPGYEYNFQIGVYYSYKGKKAVKWINQSFYITGITDIVKYWQHADPEPLLIGEIKTIDAVTFAEYKTRIDNMRKLLSQEPYFKLPEIVDI